MNDHVPTLDQCKRLKELGMPQETEFVWFSYEEPHMDHTGFVYYIEKYELTSTSGLLISNTKFAAPLATEVLKWLPLGISIDKGAEKYIVLAGTDGEYQTDKLLPNALADLLIWCVEQGHVTFGKEKP